MSKVAPFFGTRCIAGYTPFDIQGIFWGIYRQKYERWATGSVTDDPGFRQSTRRRQSKTQRQAAITFCQAHSYLSSRTASPPTPGDIISDGMRDETSVPQSTLMERVTESAATEYYSGISTLTE